MSFKKKISIFGVTGSVGRAAVDVILSQPDKFEVQVVTAGSDAMGLGKIAKQLNARKAVINDESKLDALKTELTQTPVLCAAGCNATEDAAKEPCDLMLAAIVGFAGLRPILKALEAGISVAIANKEPLVAAGHLVMEAAHKSGAKIIPVDSEHNAIFQVLENHNRAAIEKIILTASGGPFRQWSAKDIEKATPEQALRHPNWSMGPKISIDSATMMNKALEIIEAHYLFGLPPEKIEVVIHPQSIIHSMVSYTDGSVLAQLGPSDMRVPIAYALGWPGRLNIQIPKLDFKTLGNLSFESPDFIKFPALALAYECLKKGPNACIALNAANEVAVTSFLENEIGFGHIMGCVTNILTHEAVTKAVKAAKTVEEIEEYDNIVRQLAKNYIMNLNKEKPRKEIIRQ